MHKTSEMPWRSFFAYFFLGCFISTLAYGAVMMLFLPDVLGRVIDRSTWLAMAGALGLVEWWHSDRKKLNSEVKVMKMGAWLPICIYIGIGFITSGHYDSGMLWNIFIPLTLTSLLVLSASYVIKK